MKNTPIGRRDGGRSGKRLSHIKAQSERQSKYYIDKNGMFKALVFGTELIFRINFNEGYVELLSPEPQQTFPERRPKGFLSVAVPAQETSIPKLMTTIWTKVAMLRTNKDKGRRV
jgi:hypothetical protein